MRKLPKKALAAKRLKSIADQERISLRDSFRGWQSIPRFFREIYAAGPRLFILNLLGRLLKGFSPVVLLWIGKVIIDEIVFLLNNPDGDFTRLWTYVAIELGVALLTDLIGRGVTLTDGLLGDLYSNASSERIIHKAADLSMSQLENPVFYDKLERARMQTNSRVSLMSNVLAQGEGLLSIISLIAGLIYFEPWLILLLILSIVPAFINELKFSSDRYSLARSWTSERRELDYLRYIGANNRTAQEVKLFGLTGFIAGRFRDMAAQYYRLTRRLAVRQSLFGGLFNLLGVIAYYGAYILIIYRTLGGLLTLGELTFLSGSFNRLQTNMQGFFSRFTRISESALYLKDYFDFIDLEPESPGGDVVPMPDRIREGFEFREVYFTYPESDTPVLKGVSFRIRAGEKIAFVGQNGAGKTTLIKLILQFYQPTSGQILLDGTDISRFDKEAYRKRFGVIFQDYFRYEFTLRENIAVGDIGAVRDDTRIGEAARKSLADQVVQEMADGLEQQLGRRFARGQELSGGQWQKVALARAYMKDADVMVLDEPTASLDARAEYEVFERFIGLTRGRTSIIISHRFSTVRMADRILVLEDGVVTALGTHEDLMEQGGLYAELFTLQAAGYQ
ncbi:MULTISPECIES: ABC transporter ATP-binding protein [Robiginitalea]|uniref:ABC transporter ATP-binding protein n=1 Tax=Robiginitalea TaxID=252306 RepID=UPI0002E1EF80|nr:MULTISPECIES: ABC transporter ATP-binding protein [Robiginitalea]MDC6353074.1 ABC transporter ATP-binding protein [Robiginitalea sp. PM2]MDC6373759.1 ABC transporter ATP-binding protein [Robiginitalea sp. SP8]